MASHQERNLSCSNSAYDWASPYLDKSLPQAQTRNQVKTAARTRATAMVFLL